MREANFPISAIHGDMPQKDWNRMIFLYEILCSLIGWSIGGHLDTYVSCGKTLKNSVKWACWRSGRFQDRDAVMEAFREGRSRWGLWEDRHQNMETSCGGYTGYARERFGPSRLAHKQPLPNIDNTGFNDISRNLRQIFSNDGAMILWSWIFYLETCHCIPSW